MATVVEGLGLELSSAKTRIVGVAKWEGGYDFLGFHRRMGHKRAGCVACASVCRNAASVNSITRPEAYSRGNRLVLAVATSLAGRSRACRLRSTLFRRLLCR